MLLRIRNRSLEIFNQKFYINNAVSPKIIEILQKLFLKLLGIIEIHHFYSMPFFLPVSFDRNTQKKDIIKIAFCSSLMDIL